MSKELEFSNEEEALQYLSDLTGKKIKVAGNVTKVVIYSKEAIGGKNWDNISYDFAFVRGGETAKKVLGDIYEEENKHIDEDDEINEIKITESESWEPKKLIEIMEEECDCEMSLTQAAIARCDELN